VDHLRVEKDAAEFRVQREEEAPEPSASQGISGVTIAQQLGGAAIGASRRPPLAADRVTRIGPKAAAVAALMLSTHGGASSHPELVNTLVAERARAKAPKLLAVAADERHLFVWIDPSHGRRARDVQSGAA
jgi:hypothetical protein